MDLRCASRVLACLTVGAAVLAVGGRSQAKSSPPPTVPVSASLGARALPIIKPPPSVPGPLNGEIVPRALAFRRPIAVVVDNYSPDARPQSGLSRASVVIETLAEAGITRLFALFLEQDASRVGPVRSSRVYFDRWAAAYHAILAHVGGNDDAQDLLWHLPPVFNMDEAPWEYPSHLQRGDPFWRTNDRAAPYNVYVNTYWVRASADAHHQDWSYLQASLPHRSPAPFSRRRRSGSVLVSFVDPLAPYIPPDPDYQVRYAFDRATDTYLRTVGGKPQVDALTHKALRASNVIAILTGPAVADPAAGITLFSISIPTIGSGPALYFSDGRVWRGVWQQRDQFAPLRFLGAHGRRQVAFNPGQTWIEVLPKDSTVRWTFR